MTGTTYETETEAIAAEGLTKRFGDTLALAGLDLVLPAGAVVGLLGHNGAGKTTAVRILATLLRPDGGRATVCGHDVVREAASVRERIALAGQQATLDERLTGVENLVLLGRLQGLRRRTAAARSGELLERFGLTEAGGRLVKTYSGGMRRRLDLAASLVVPRPVVFLDEPTTGLDPAGRLEMHDAIRALAEEGAAVLLTTQYLEEADRLAGRIAVISKGSCVAEGTPSELKGRVGDRRVEVALADSGEAEAARLALGGEGLDASFDERSGRLSAPAPAGAEDLERAIAALARAEIVVDEASLHRPTLDDAFIALAEGLADEPGALREEVPV